MLTIAMVSATLATAALSVLSAFVIDDFHISRSQLGFLFTVFSLVGGLGAPTVGKAADLAGGRRVLAGLFVVTGVAVLALAAAPHYGWVVVATLVGGLGLAAGNPATNKLIALHVSPRQRGSVIGIKQSGPPLGIVLAGALLPAGALLLGWRLAVALAVLLPLVGFLAALWLVPPDPAREVVEETSDHPVGRSGAVVWLSIIGFAVAGGFSAVLAFLPLYAQQAAGMTVAMGGLLMGVMGTVGVAARILWGLLGGRFRHVTTPLGAVAVISVFSAVAIWLGASGGAWLLWAGSVGAGASMFAWHAIGWLAVVSEVSPGAVGSASGTVHLGSGMGFAMGPPAFGALVDASGTYAWGWALVTLAFVAAAAATWVWRRSVEPARAAP